MTEYSTKLYFYPVRGRAETARLLLMYSGTKYEDIKVSKEQWPAMIEKMPVGQSCTKHENIKVSKEQWPAVKEKMPTGQMPVLDVDGIKICQSTAIIRYLARECGLTGKNSLDMARADMIVEGIRDMWDHLKVVYLPKIEGNKKTSDEKWAQMVDTTLKLFLDTNTRFLNENGGQWFVGDSLTYADIAIAEFVSCMEDCFCQSILDNYPQLKAFKEKIFSLPKLKEYVSQRPATVM